jgi:hypothetical protein
LAVSALFDQQPRQLERSCVLRRQIHVLDDDVYLHPTFTTKDLLAPSSGNCSLSLMGGRNWPPCGRRAIFGLQAPRRRRIQRID